MKKKWIGALICAVAMVCCFAMATVTAFAAGDDDYVTVVKSLVSTGSMGAGEVEWAEAGAPDAWPGFVEEIKDASQEDGGDVILRTELDSAGTALVSGQYGFARQSTSIQKAAYQMAGLTMKFYANSAPNYMMMFTQNSGWYAASTYHWELWFQNQSVTLRYSVEGGDNMINAGSQSITYYTDYDYFSDPVTEGYKNVGDTSKQFVGTANVLEIKTVDGNLWVVFNGKQLFNLTEKGIVSKVINHCSAEGMFLCYYGTGASRSAMKITDIYNVKSSWETGVPSNYTVADANSVENKANDAGNVQFRSVESKGYDYEIRYNEAHYFSDFTNTFYFDGQQLAEGDSVTVTLADSGEGSDTVAFAFAKKSINTANLTVKAGAKTLGTAEVPFYFNGSALNTVALKETVPFVLTVNGKSVDIALADFSELAFTDGKILIGYRLEASAVSTLTPASYASNLVETFDSVPGLTIAGDVVIKSDGDYKMIYNKADDGYSVSYDANKLITDSFELSYRFGKYGENSGAFSISLGGDAAALIFRFAPETADTAKLTVAVSENGAETSVAETTVDFDWAYEYGVRKLGFANDGGYSYLVYLDGALACSIDGANMNQIDQVVALIGATANATFTVEKDALTAFAFCDYEYYVGKSSAGGWGEGAIPSTQFAYDANDNTVIAFSNAHSYMKQSEVLVDGFAMTFKTYAKSGSASPSWALSTSSAWYSNQSAIMFMIAKSGDSKASFSILYTNKVEGDYEYITSSAENKGIATFTVDEWNWNNGVENTIELHCTDGVWRWTANGQILEPEEGSADYSDYLNELYTLYPSEKKTAYVQIYGGNKMVWNISSIAEYVPNADPVATQPSLKDSYTVGETVTVTLSSVFTDPNGDALTFVLADDCAFGSIENGVWSFTADEKGVYTIKIEAYDGNGGQATLTFDVNVVEAGGTDNPVNPGGCDCSSSMLGTSIAALALLAAASAVFAVRRKRG